MDGTGTPLLVLVGGPGGCGKSTLARALGDAMRVLHIERDAVKAAIAVTCAQRSPSGAPVLGGPQGAAGGEFGQRAFAITYETAALLLDAGVSIVIDQAWRRGRSEDELLPLVARARAVQLHVTTSPDLARRRARERGARFGLATVEESIDALDREWDAFAPLDLATPLLRVDATEGYDPPLTAIVEWIWSTTASTTQFDDVPGRP